MAAIGMEWVMVMGVEMVAISMGMEMLLHNLEIGIGKEMVMVMVMVMVSLLHRGFFVMWAHDTHTHTHICQGSL